MPELYKMTRPASFREMIGQDKTTKQIMLLLKEDRFPQSILISGPSGCGKTTIARILQKKLGCSKWDFKEINAADTKGIDKIREIHDRMGFAAHSKSRIYLFDEAHKLTNDAQTALLKMLEDTPPDVYFILCTTDPQKVIITIRNRCSSFTVRSLTKTELQSLIIQTCERGNINPPSDEVQDKIIECCGGSARRCIVILDQIRSMISEEEQLDAITALDSEAQAKQICQLLLKRARWNEISPVLKKINEEPETIRRMILGYMRVVLLGGKNASRAFLIMQCFEGNFYDTGAAGLAMACFDCCSQK
jgi:DNA polymerase-3 subunit gamma/tau